MQKYKEKKMNGVKKQKKGHLKHQRIYEFFLRVSVLIALNVNRKYSANKMNSSVATK